MTKPHPRDAGANGIGVPGGTDEPLRATREQRLLQVLSDVVERFTATRSGGFAEAVPEVLAEIGTAAQAQRASLFRFDHEHDRIEASHAWARDGVGADGQVGLVVRFDERRAWLEPLLAGAHHDARCGEAPGRAAASGSGVEAASRSILTVPTRAGGTVIGALSVEHERESATWTPTTIALLQVVADVIGGARDRDDLAQRALAEARWREALTDMVAWGLEQRLAAPLYAGLLERVTRLAPEADAGSILLRGDDGRFRFVAAHGYDLACLADVVFEPDEVAHPHDLRATTQLLMPFGRNERLSDERRDALNAFGGAERITATLVLPLRTGDLPLGFLYLDRIERDRPFARDTVAMAEVAATQASLVIQRLSLERMLRQRQGELEHIASVDALTGLPNRSAFLEALRTALAQATRRGSAAALLYLDLDGFKEVNDALGHDVGDDVLHALGERLRSAVRGSDVVARLGGDEFTVIVADVGDVSEAGRVAEKLLAAVQRPVQVGAATVRLTTSIGIALFPSDARDPPELLRQADAAMYRAKAGGRDGFRFYTAEIDVTARERLQLTSDLRTALAADAVDVVYQPRVDLGNGRWVGVEALARWRHPERGDVPPEVFVPLAEETGLIDVLAARVWREASACFAGWAAHPVLGVGRLSVNVSTREFLYGDVVARLQELLASSRLRAAQLELQVREGTLLRDLDLGVSRLEALRGMGVAVALDDFGTAHAALAHLKRLPLDVVKIDRSFVATIDAQEAASNVAIVRAVVEIGAAHGFTIVAEGIERPSQEEVLRDLGCVFGQGYLYAPPRPAEALMDAADAAWAR